MYFTGLPYEAEVNGSEEERTLHLTADHAGGLRVEKTMSLRPGKRTVRVHYAFSNGTQRVYRLWVRNFPVPGGSPLSERHGYTLPLWEGPLHEIFVSGYFEDLEEPWAALHDTVSGAGMLAVVPGVSAWIGSFCASRPLNSTRRAWA